MIDKIDTKHFEAMLAGLLSADRPDDYVCVKGIHGERLISNINSDLLQWLEFNENGGSVKVYVNPIDAYRSSQTEQYPTNERTKNFTTIFLRVFGNFATYKPIYQSYTLNSDGRKLVSLFPNEPSLIIENAGHHLDLLWFLSSPVQDANQITEIQRSLGQIVEAGGFETDTSGWEITCASIAVAPLVAWLKLNDVEIVEHRDYRPEIIKNTSKKYSVADFVVLPALPTIVDAGNQAFDVDSEPKCYEVEIKDEQNK